MKCRHCEAPLNLQMIDLGAAPPSNDFHATQDEPENHYPLRVLVCEKCWLVQTDIDLFKLDHDQLFTKDYPYFSSTSPSWVEHARDYAREMTEWLELTKDSLVVEIGSNDGYLLQFFDCRKYGIEPTATAKVAIAKGINTIEDFFTEKMANSIKFGYIGQSPDLLICNNVLAHVPDINDFVKGIVTLLKPDGIASFEFPWLLNIVRENQFDTIYHEHYSYLSLMAVTRIFEAHGLHIFHVDKLQTHGGSLRVFASPAAHPVDISVLNTQLEELDAGVMTEKFYIGLQKNADAVKNNLVAFLLDCKSKGKQVAGFGAAAKGNTFLNYAGIRSDLLSYVVDETPAKQGKFMPGSRIPVVAEFRGTPDYVLILPWNFKREIIRKLSPMGCKFVTAIPHLEIHGNLALVQEAA